MKTNSTIWFAGIAALSILSCQKKSDVAPVVDPRNARIGSYACNVQLGNFQTKEVFSSYLDTVDVSKQGDTGLLIASRKRRHFPF